MSRVNVLTTPTRATINEWTSVFWTVVAFPHRTSYMPFGPKVATSKHRIRIPQAKKCLQYQTMNIGICIHCLRIEMKKKIGEWVRAQKKTVLEHVSNAKHQCNSYISSESPIGWLCAVIELIHKISCFSSAISRSINWISLNKLSHISIHNVINCSWIRIIWAYRRELLCIGSEILADPVICHFIVYKWDCTIICFLCWS